MACATRWWLDSQESTWISAAGPNSCESNYKRVPAPGRWDGNPLRPERKTFPQTAVKPGTLRENIPIEQTLASGRVTPHVPIVRVPMRLTTSLVFPASTLAVRQHG